MVGLEISLLGSLQVLQDGWPDSDLGYDKVRALLAYLAAESDRPQRRETLAALFWPDLADGDARHGLSQALMTLRHAIGDASAVPPYLIVTHGAIGFNRASNHWIDVRVFTSSMAACDRHSHRQLSSCTSCAGRLAEATGLYSGDFLAGFSPSIGQEFEDWVRTQRERLAGMFDALAHLGEYYERRGAHETALAVIERQLALDPLRESAHRQLMRVLWLNGERAAALAQFERCRQILEDELEVEPEEETTNLFHSLRTSQPASAVSAIGQGPSMQRVQVPPDALNPLLGRARELEQIAKLLEDPTCRLLTLVGPGGIGKTRLAAEVMQEGVSNFTDGAVFVPLAPVNEVALIVPAIAQALGIALHDRAVRRADSLSGRRSADVAGA